MGTAMAPVSTVPQYATSHSGRFSPHRTTLSPLVTPAAASRAANPRDARVTSAYECRRTRYPSS